MILPCDYQLANFFFVCCDQNVTSISKEGPCHIGMALDQIGNTENKQYNFFFRNQNLIVNIL